MSVPQLVSLIILVVLIAGILFLFLPGTRSRTPPDPSVRDDDRYWYLSSAVYNNPDDPDLIVRRRYMPGWTLNIGHPVGRLIVIGVLVLLVALALLSQLVPGFNTYGCHPSSGCHL
jgi:uncharacterized membrane protein